MNNNEKTKKGGAAKVGGALLTGLALGALVGLLTAPQKGKKTQADLSKLAKKWLAILEENSGDAQVKIKRLLKSAGGEAGQVYELMKTELLPYLARQKKKLTSGEYKKVAQKLVRKYQKKLTGRE